MNVKAKYPIKIGKVLVSANTIGEVPDSLPESLKTAFPGLKPKPGSKFVPVIFPGLEACIVHKDQLVWLNSK